MLTYLALGDSYTIGEQVMLSESFPCQLVQLLRNEGMAVCAPEIIAKTGWTTDELAAAIAETTFLKEYDIVTLLIGVNNQYRGRSVEEYTVEFEALLKQGISFAGNNPEKVFVLSIPDWGTTPFAEGRDREMIAKEINSYNSACEDITKNHGCCFIEITFSQREDNDLHGMLAPDGLHPSGTEYAKWAKRLSDKIISLHSAGTAP